MDVSTKMATNARRPIRCLLIGAVGDEDSTLSYYHGLIGALPRLPGFECQVVNLRSGSMFSTAMQLVRIAIARCDVVILLHSIYSNARRIPESIVECLARRSVPKVVFAANEYKSMPDKIRLYRDLSVDLLLTQLPSPAAHDLYRTALGCEVAEFPHSGLWEEDLYPIDTAPRSIDIGYRAYDQPYYFGHLDRTLIMDLVGPVAAAAGLKADMSTNPDKRFNLMEWQSFLRDCRAQLGVESGVDYFELSDSIRTAVNEFTAENPSVEFRTVHQLFFENYGPRISGRAISGRIVEAAAARCVQILMEGEYSGYFEPDVHYISLARDGSNAAEAVGKLKDTGYCEKLSRAAMERAWAEFSYERLGARLRKLLDAYV